MKESNTHFEQLGIPFNAGEKGLVEGRVRPSIGAPISIFQTKRVTNRPDW